jgi:hypothetical protein
VLSTNPPIAVASLSVSKGSWTNTPTSYTYQWERCNSSGENCSAISGATSSSYTPVGGDVGNTLIAEVTATNAIGSGTASTVPSGAVLPEKPHNTVLPVVSGSALEEGVPLNAGTGTWTGSPTSFAYQWEHCDLGENPCGPISGATGSTYTPTSAFVGKFIRVVVTAKNASGEASVTSRAVGRILPPPPVNTSLPVLSTSPPIDGVSLSVSKGSWTNSPTSFAYQWKRCDSSGENCSAISGATNSTYVPSDTDVGHTLAASVTASNSGGTSTPTASAPSGLVQQLPTNTSAPALSTNSPSAGTPLNVSTGSWSGYPSLFTFAYQWLRCNGSGQNCQSIGGATNATYTPTQADEGSTLQAQVTATNTAGQTTASTTPSNVVTNAPSPTSTPTFTITPAQGQSVGLVNVAFSGTPSPTLAYQWRHCTSTSLATCTNISGATLSTYTPVSADQGLYLSALITATNSFGSASASVVPVAVNATYTQAVEADHPAANWTFNDPVGSSTAADSVGWGALSGGSPTFGVPGPFTNSGTAMSLSSGFMNHSGTPLTSPTTFTVEIWFKATSADIAGNFNEYIVANQEGWIWLGLASCSAKREFAPGNCLDFIWQQPAGAPFVNQTGYQFTDTNWHYLVMTHGPDGFTHVYVDGVEYGPFNSSSVYNGLTTGTFLGGLKGSFGHSAYYNSQLSAQRVAVHWNASKTS